MGLNRRAKRALKAETRQAEERSRIARAKGAEALRLSIAKNHELVAAARAAVAKWSQKIGIRVPEIVIDYLREEGWGSELLNYSLESTRVWHGASVSMTWRAKRHTFRADYRADTDSLTVRMELAIPNDSHLADVNTLPEMARALALEKKNG